MFAYQLSSTANPVELKEVPIPRAAKNGVVVKMEATPLLSYTDLYLQGKLPYVMPPMPFTPGTNAVGTIHEVGPGVLHLRVGQRVMVESFWTKDEAVESPGQVLLGLTGISEDSGPMLEEYPNGTWREYGDFPAAVVHPLDGLDQYDSATLSALAKVAIPFGGLRRAALQAGETVIINGASGYFGSAAVMGALALGATVVATGRHEAGLRAVQKTLDPEGIRVQIVVQQCDEARDTAALKEAAHGGAHAALCMVGQARDAQSTLSTLQALRRNGRMVLMGSLLPRLPIPYGQMLLNNWELKGNFMYRRADFHAVIALVRNGSLNLRAIQAKTFPYHALEAAMSAANSVKGLNAVVLTF